MSSAAEFNHLKCLDNRPDIGISKNCYVENGSLNFELGSANEGFKQEMSFTVQSNFNCPGNTQTQIELSAGQDSPGYKLRFGSETVTINGTGPVFLSDTNSALTKSLTFGSTCSLSFELKEVKPSQAQIDAWMTRSQLQSDELNSLVSAYQTRTSIMFWDKKVKDGDDKNINLLKKLRDDTEIKSKASATNFVLNFRLKKYNEILEKSPSEEIYKAYDEILTEIVDSHTRAIGLRFALIAYQISVPESLTSAISLSDQYTNK
jgi:hypothetical protein